MFQFGSGAAPFSKWRVILVLINGKTESMKNILELGGAVILSSGQVSLFYMTFSILVIFNLIIINY